MDVGKEKIDASTTATTEPRSTTTTNVVRLLLKNMYPYVVQKKYCRLGCIQFSSFPKTKQRDGGSRERAEPLPPSRLHEVHDWTTF